MADLATKIADITLRKSFNTLLDGKTGNPFDYVERLKAEKQRAAAATVSSSRPPTPKSPT